MVTAIQGAERSAAYAGLIELVAAQLEGLLEDLPAGALEARRRITCDLHFQPRPEELQAIIKLAEDRDATGVRRELPRRLLATRVLAVREIGRMRQMKPLQPEEIAKLARILPDLAREARDLEEELGHAITPDSGLPMTDRDFLMQVGRALSTTREELIGSAVLVARLAELTRAVIEGDLETRTPMLQEADRLAIAAMVNGDAAEGLARPTIDALAMRSAVDGLLAGWSACGRPSEDDEARRAARDGLLETMRRTRICIESLAARLQVAQDEALVAGAGTLADELRAAGRGLFSAKLRLAKVLRAPYEDVDEDEVAGEEIDSIEAMLRSGIAADTARTDTARAASEEEVYLGALKDMRDRGQERLAERVDEPEIRRKRERKRRIVLIATAAVLGVVSVIVNFVLLPPRTQELQAPPVTELSPHTNAKRVETAGPIVFTHVEGWNGLDEGERKAQVDKLGELVSEDGFTGVFVIDEYGEVAGAWDKRAGSGLVEPR